MFACVGICVRYVFECIWDARQMHRDHRPTSAPVHTSVRCCNFPATPFRWDINISDVRAPCGLDFTVYLDILPPAHHPCPPPHTFSVCVYVCVLCVDLMGCACGTACMCVFVCERKLWQTDPIAADPICAHAYMCVCVCKIGDQVL